MLIKAFEQYSEYFDEQDEEDETSKKRHWLCDYVLITDPDKITSLDALRALKREHDISFLKKKLENL